MDTFSKPQDSFAKIIFIAIILIMISGCLTPQIKTSDDVVKPALAWGDSHPDWDKYLSDAVNGSSLQSTIKTPCKTLVVKDCLIQTISIMAKYESSFNPAAKYIESFADVHGVKVVSRGLLQISQESANQGAYGCKIIKSEQLHDAKINLECAVKIAVYWANKDGTFFGGDKLGIGHYWAVGRLKSQSNAKILKYLEAL